LEHSFHCPTYGIFNCKKQTSSCHKRNIWLYEKGNYDDSRRDLQSVQWDTLIIESDVNQSVTNEQIIINMFKYTSFHDFTNDTNQRYRTIIL
jgi:hypothetical protein